jgi:hypothetical protein
MSIERLRGFAAPLTLLIDIIKVSARRPKNLIISSNGKGLNPFEILSV